MGEMGGGGKSFFLVDKATGGGKGGEGVVKEDEAGVVEGLGKGGRGGGKGGGRGKRRRPFLFFVLVNY